ncbi:hypothetical protein NQ314_008802 [Rhamnusium bicolor]|uniref:Regulatory protein zeste n=1 Tax=Rhamnusium bicolor TaxID=1586634 RepID=A0AAV8Y8P1_9CUCU|nr:hypothetical protein NQ314_008802 [Rhamnusium bicolor]
MDANGEKCNNKRAFNFSSKEENILISLIKEKYVSQIENKKTDTNANRLKTEAWVKLAKEFNSCCGDSYRDAQVLRNKYLNMKKRSKKNFSEEKKHLHGTGGGSPKSYTTTDIDKSIKEIIGSQMTGLSSEFDNDQENMEVKQDHILLIVENDHENAPYAEIGSMAKSSQKVCSENFKGFANTTHADVAGFDTTSKFLVVCLEK